MMNRFRVSSTLPRKLEELGLSPEAVLRQARLPMALFNQEKILVSTEEFFALYRGIAEASNDPGFGLKLGTEESGIRLLSQTAKRFTSRLCIKRELNGRPGWSPREGVVRETCLLHTPNAPTCQISAHRKQNAWRFRLSLDNRDGYRRDCSPGKLNRFVLDRRACPLPRSQHRPATACGA